MTNPVESIRKVGVVGAGQMGNGIAHVFALSGYDVVMSDLEQDRIDAATETIRGNLGRQVGKDLISQADSDAALRRITGVTSFDSFGDCDLVVESASENEDVKKSIFRDLVEVVPDHTILTSNTSSISITRLATPPTGPSGSWGCTS